MIRYKKYLLFVFFTATVLIANGCSNITETERQPDVVQGFVNQYYPGIKPSSSLWQGDTYNLKLRSGTIITFDRAYNWISINSIHNAVPQTFLFNCTPPAFYEYLQSIEAANRIQRISRTQDKFIAEMPQSVITYEISSGNISVRTTKP